MVTPDKMLLMEKKDTMQIENGGPDPAPITSVSPSQIQKHSTNPFGQARGSKDNGTNGDRTVDSRVNGYSNPGSPVAAKLESGELCLDS